MSSRPNSARVDNRLLTDSDVQNSKFYVDITNALGLDYKKVRGELLALSLSKPEKYYELRSELIDRITRKQVADTYYIFFHILKTGYAPKEGSEGLEQVLVNGKPFQPNLPDQKISEFSQKCAQHIEHMAEECINLILPEDYLALSQQRQKDLLVARGMRN